jgi:predicted nucleic acid-binding protein
VLLADTSAWVWTRAVGGELRIAFDEDLVEGQIATCDMVRLELLYSTRNATEFTSLRSELDALPNCPIGVEHWKRALEVYEQLAHQGGLHHRAVRHPDLLIAAAAEAAGIPVLHYDEDYDRIADITEQDVRWLAPRGSLS